jgi:hypothetical protein
MNKEALQEAGHRARARATPEMRTPIACCRCTSKPRRAEAITIGKFQQNHLNGGQEEEAKPGGCTRCPSRAEDQSRRDRRCEARSMAGTGGKLWEMSSE